MTNFGLYADRLRAVKRSQIIKHLRKLYFAFSRHGDNGRDLRVFGDDVFFVGYPKSGNTWLNFLIGCLRSENPDDIDFYSIERTVADIYYNAPAALQSLDRPRFLKSHEPVDSRYPKVVYIVRDPRAVAVSYYHHLIGMGQIPADFPISKFVPGFIDGSFDDYGTWGKHVHDWLVEYKKEPNRLMVVKYEDLKSEATAILSRIALFIRLDAPPAKIEAALLSASPDNMRKLEIEARKSGHPSYAAFREGSFFIRKASAGDWKQELTPVLQEQIEVAWSDVMQELGYVKR